MRLTFACCLLLTAVVCVAQNIGIGTTSPNSSAQLDISSGIRGILIPRMTTAAVSGIANPAKRLMIYDSTRNQVLVNMGTPSAPDWENIVANSGWSLSGNSNTSATQNFIGTTDGQSLNFLVNNQPAGRLTSEGSVYLGVGVESQNTASAQESPLTVAIGSSALAATTSGVENVAIGPISLVKNTTGSDNIAIGIGTMKENTSGSENIAIGISSLGSNIGSQNTAVGDYTLLKTTFAKFNTAVGYSAGESRDYGYNNVFLGANTDATMDGSFNVIAVGQGVLCTASSQAPIGNTATNSIGGYANWTNFSDGRYKKNMKEDVKGIDFIMRLRPLTYNLDVTGTQRKLGTKRPTDAGSQKAIADKESMVFSGFAAQEVEKAVQDAGYDFSGVDKPKNANDFYGLRYADFVVRLVKAVQEQQKMIEALQKEIADLKQHANH
jgi:trimeric autotransporter adhesin